MKNYHMYCLSLHSENFSSLKKIQYTPVGVGNNVFTNEWLKDNTKINIMVSTVFITGSGKI